MTQQLVDKVKTGIAGLDEILDGGIRRQNSVLVEGAPGTGKTTFGLQYLVNGALKYNEPGILITFEIEPKKLLADARAFGWDLEKLEADGFIKVIYSSPAVVLDELHTSDNYIAEVVKQMGAKRIVLDSLTPLRHYAEMTHKKPFRHSLFMLCESLAELDLTPVLTREVREGGRSQATEIHDEQYLVDSIIELRHELHNRNIHRYIEIIKARGCSPVLGQHSFQMSSKNGIQVYRRAQSRPKYFDIDAQLKQQPKERVSSGVEGLDKLLGGGFYRSSVTLVAGISGTGKTLLGLRFLAEGARTGEKGLYISLEETPGQLKREAEAIGIDQNIIESELISFIYDPPVELELDVHFAKIFETIEAKEIKRIVLDSLASYQSSNPEEMKEYLYAMSAYFKNRGVVAILNYESPELIGISQISAQPRASSLVDNIILLNYVEISTRLRRAITVPKCRGSANIRKTHEFTISETGIKVLEPHPDEENSVAQEPFESYYGLLGRAPTRISKSERKKSSAQEEESRSMNGATPKTLRNNETEKTPSANEEKTDS